MVSLIETSGLPLACNASSVE